MKNFRGTELIAPKIDTNLKKTRNDNEEIGFEHSFFLYILGKILRVALPPRSPNA